ncbi:MAG: alkaline phosphatase family protein [Phycisphaerales bacterium]|nr:alkaline phosphatase family protein [Phycisphaerales bacterium]
MPTTERLAIIGLDSAEPSLVFERWRTELPNLAALADRGLWGRLESCIPPITVPAWACMASGRDPGELGIYGFRNRRDWTYENLGIATNLEIRVPRLWDCVTQAGRPSIVVAVPPTFPLRNPPMGCMLTCFLTPSVESAFAHPPELAAELAARFGPYCLDAEDFRTSDKAALLERINAMTRQRMAICRHLVSARPWSLLWLVDLGIDRVHHGFWQYMDPEHHRYVAGHPLAGAIREHYRLVDEELGALLPLLDDGRTAIWVVSDHGAKRMDGGLCINDWLIQEGLLALKSLPTAPQPFDLAAVDWSRTRVWGEGGYYARLYVNKAGREPRGIVSDAEYEPLVCEVRRRLEGLVDHRDRPMGNRAYRPAELYRATNGAAPDLIALLGDLHWRGVGSVGNPSLYVFDADAGPDDANHAQQGMHILVAPGGPRGELDASIYDVFPTSQRLLGLPPTTDVRGRVLVG